MTADWHGRLNRTCVHISFFATPDNLPSLSEVSFCYNSVVFVFRFKYFRSLRLVSIIFALWVHLEYTVKYRAPAAIIQLEKPSRKEVGWCTNVD